MIKIKVNKITNPNQWVRPTEWLDLPEVSQGDNVFYGLYAVFEDGFNTLAIEKNQSTFIDWGDGTTETSTGFTEHTYDYATILSPVNVYEDGRNYKQVIVRIDLTTSTTQLYVDRVPTVTGYTANKPQNWLDIVMAVPDTDPSTFDYSISAISNQLRAVYLERVNIISNGKNLLRAEQTLSYCHALRALNLDISDCLDVDNLLLNSQSDVRKLDGTPLDIISSTQLISTQNMFNNSNIREFGDFDVSIATGGSAFATFASNEIVEKIGNVDVSQYGNTGRLFLACPSLKSIGTITFSSTCFSMDRMFLGCDSLQYGIVSGDMSGVTNTAFAFDNSYAMERIILPNLTVGIDVSDTRITGQNLQDMFTSLGTANGSQTITLPLFTSGEPTAIATGKGYTIAYA